MNTCSYLLSFSVITKQFGMGTKTYQFYDIPFPVIPDQQIIFPYMTFHMIFVISTEGMRLVFFW